MKNNNALNTRKHGDREDLAGEYRWGDLGQLVLLVIFLGVWVLDSFVLRCSTFLSQYIPIFVKIPVTVFLFLISGFLARKGLQMVFGEIRTEPRIIKEGVFSIVRHPIYLGVILFYLGLWIFTFSLIVLVVWIISVVFYYLISKYEETLLLDKFGEEYKAYKNSVPMLFPKIINK